jgi:hypothetical protein
MIYDIYICVWYASYIYIHTYIYNYITYVSNFQHMCHCQNAVSGYGHIPSWESLQWVSKSLLGWWPSLSPTWASFPSFDNDRLLCILSSCLILSCPNSQLSIYRILQASCHFRPVGPLRLQHIKAPAFCAFPTGRDTWVEACGCCTHKASAFGDGDGSVTVCCRAPGSTGASEQLRKTVLL